MPPLATRRAALAAAAIVASLLVSLAPAQQGGLTTEVVAGLRAVGQAVVSPDGDWVAYTLAVPRRPDEADGSAHTELHLVPFAGGRTRGFITGPGRVGGLSWTPDSKSVLFTGRRGDAKATTLYAIPVDGGEARALFLPKASIRSYAVSHDGKTVAYTYTEPKSAEQKKREKRGFNQIVFDEQVRPTRLALVDLASGEQRDVAVEGAPWQLGFGPADDRLAMWMSPTPSTDDRYMRKRLFVCELASGRVEKVADNPGKVGNFSWSPDGTRIAFVAGIDIHDPRESTLMVVPSTGGEMRALTPPEFAGHVERVGWLDDDTVVFLASEGCEATLSVQPAAGGDRRVVLARGAGIWRGFTACAAGSCLALVGEAPSHPREVFAYELGHDRAPRRLTESNPDLGSFRFAKQEVISYRARDGVAIEAVLISPLERRSGSRYPLIVQVHGGPESHYANGWLTAYSMPGQVAAAQGYAVLYPNYRGSTGRGVAFSKADQGRMAKEEFDDIVDGVDHLIARGLAHKDRVGITGGSYGGYASAWGATYYSERFAASVMFVGISEQISKVFTTDIPDESYYSHWKMRPFGNWQTFLEASPIYYTERAKTPILIAHGKDDPRVPVNQSIELYRALKIKGDVPVRLVLYPGEGHGNRRAASRLDYSLRQMRWFDHFLKHRSKKLPPADLDHGRRQGTP